MSKDFHDECPRLRLFGRASFPASRGWAGDSPFLITFRLLGAALLCLLIPAGCDRQSAPAPTAIKTLTTPTGIEMVEIPAGTFVMGNEGGDDDEKPAHSVAITSFYMDRYEEIGRASCREECRSRWSPYH